MVIECMKGDGVSGVDREDESDASMVHGSTYNLISFVWYSL
jgi:hypothetical protein